MEFKQILLFLLKMEILKYLQVVEVKMLLVKVIKKDLVKKVV